MVQTAVGEGLGSTIKRHLGEVRDSLNGAVGRFLGGSSTRSLEVVTAEDIETRPVRVTGQIQEVAVQNVFDSTNPDPLYIDHSLVIPKEDGGTHKSVNVVVGLADQERQEWEQQRGADVLSDFQPYNIDLDQERVVDFVRQINEGVESPYARYPEVKRILHAYDVDGNGHGQNSRVKVYIAEVDTIKLSQLRQGKRAVLLVIEDDDHSIRSLTDLYPADLKHRMSSVRLKGQCLRVVLSEQDGRTIDPNNKKVTGMNGNRVAHIPLKGL